VVGGTSGETAGEKAEEPADTARLEAFSDGVFAVAITLLALDLHVPDPATLPHGPHGGLVPVLLGQWPVYLAYGLSFLTILIMWINHHNLFRLIRRTDHLFLLLNGLLLLSVTTVPFATSLLATYLRQPDKRAAQVVYGAVSLAMATAFNRMWAYASRDRRLLGPDADERMVRGVTQAYRFGPLIYSVTVVLALLSAEASLVLCILLALFFALPRRVRRSGGP
jgi:uncharacterized membrane protein